MEAINQAIFGTPNKVPHEQVYKVFQVNKEQHYSHIIIFNGNDQTTLNLSEWFSEIEIADINLHNTQVTFSNNIIHSDDTIRTIKWKVLDAMKNATVSYPEIYLYAKQTRSIDLFDIYQKITQNDKYTVSQNMLAQLLQNLHIDNDITESIPTQDEYTFETLFKYLPGQSYSINIPVGQKFASFTDYLYPADPYDNLSATENPFKQTVDNNLITFENDLLLHYGKINDNNLYLCLIGDVLPYTETMGMSDEYIIRLYYPVIANKDIITRQGLDENRYTFIDEDAELRNNKEIVQYNTDMDMLYKIYNERISELNDVKKGIKQIELIIHPETVVNLPLDVIFKNIHASKEVQCVKYNPGSRQENIYRLYCEEITKAGNKKPLLKKSTITNLSNKSAQREILLYIVNEMTTELHLTISYNGNIRIMGTFASSISVDALDMFLKKTVNGIIDNLNAFLQQTGYKINPFISTSHNLIEIINIDYAFEVGSVISDMAFDKYVNCLTTVFEISKRNAGVLIMNYKRVGNYKKMNAVQSMITRVYQTSNSERAVIDALVLNYNMSDEAAAMEFLKYLNDFHQINGRYVNKTVDILENNGFSTVMQYLKTENKLITSITNIDNIAYIQTLDIYIDSISRIMLSPSSTAVPMEAIVRLCSDKRRATLPNNVEIMIPAIKPVDGEPLIRNVLLADDNEEEDDEDGDFIFFEEEDEEDEPDEAGEEEAKEKSDEELGQEEEDMDGGAKKTAVVVKEKENANIFYNKMLRLEPKIILSRKEGQFNAYSRTCPANVNRQPIILTNAEKDRIDAENRGAYGYAMRYGHSEDKTKQHWFICPRYWCMKTNLPITDPTDATKCALEDIHEFTGRYHKKGDIYIHHNPGLVKDAHPSHGVPCCFGKKWESEQLKTARIKYGVTSDDVDVPAGTDKKKDVDKKAKDDASSKHYITAPDKYVPKDRWGFMPASIMLFLDINYTDVITKKNPAFIKPNVKTFLRYGVENNQQQSFVGCIAYIYAAVHKYKENNKPIPSIKEMREILAKAITLDMYLQYQNGSLVALFQPKKQRVSKDVLAKYENTQFYNSLTPSNDAQMNFYEDTIASFERFLQYLRDDDAIIDHTYLWDIVTSVNAQLFPSGLNLVLLQISDNDITDNVELICPTNSYASNMYDVRRETVIILKRNEFYEPISQYEIVEDAENENDQGKTVRSNPTYLQQYAGPEIKRVLNIIQNTLGKYCKPRASMPNVYQYKSNIIASRLTHLLTSNGYIIQSQIVNYRRKVIGIMIKDLSEREWSVFVPCFPSSILPNITVKYSDEVEWTTYLNTRDTLLQINSKSDESILCKPMLKVIEDELIVGILTETNQFVQIDPPIPNVDDGIDVIHSSGYANSGYINADKQLATNSEEDQVRLDTIRNIKLEGQFYSAFRTALRIALSQHSNYEIRQKIMSVIDGATQTTYRVALRKIEWLIRDLLKEQVTFATYKPSVLKNLMDITDIETTYNKSQYCLVAEDGASCKVVIPKLNLITNAENDAVYFKRVSDELLRYKHVRLFVLEPKRYLNIGNSEYKLHEDELLLLQTLLDGDYFDNLIPIQANEYVKNITFDTADPAIHQKYSTEVSLAQQTSSSETAENARTFIMECIKEIKPSVIGNDTSYWRRVLPSNSREIVFNGSANCTYYILIDIMYKHSKTHMDARTIKTFLWKKYSSYLDKHKVKLLQILKMQHGKRAMIDRVIKNQVNFEDLIMSEEYYITDLDLWAIASYFNIPILLFSSKQLTTLGLSVTWAILGGKPKLDNYFCIRSPTNANTFPEYHLITPACKLVDIAGFDQMIGNVEYAQNNLEFGTYLNAQTLPINE